VAGSLRVAPRPFSRRRPAELFSPFLDSIVRQQWPDGGMARPGFVPMGASRRFALDSPFERNLDCRPREPREGRSAMWSRVSASGETSSETSPKAARISSGDRRCGNCAALTADWANSVPVASRWAIEEYQGGINALYHA
jgi:hypothetical protein